jgi:hypothetical protein
MNPDTNKFEQLTRLADDEGGDKPKRNMQKEMVDYLENEMKLVRPDGTNVPEHWSIFQIDEEIVIKGYVFKIAHIGESHLLLEPVGPYIIGNDK